MTRSPDHSPAAPAEAPPPPSSNAPRFKRWFDHLRVAQKLALISIFFVMPDSVMLYLFITAINDNIEFARMEQKGNTYQRPLEELLELLPQHRLLVLQAAGANAEAWGQLARKAGQIDAAFARLADVDGRLGRDLQFTEEGLAKRHREHFRVAIVAREWEQLKLVALSLPPAELAARYQHLVGDIRAMITHSGDTSNLILDPDLDSYYLMDATLLALPEAQDRIAEVIAHGLTVLDQKQISMQERQQFAIHANFLREADVGRVAGSLRTALREDANFYGISESLQTRVPPALDAYVRDTTAFIAETQRLAEETTPAITKEQYLAVGTKARDASFNLWRVASEEVDELLKRRVESYQHRRSKSLLVAAAALVAAVGFVTFITRSISGPLQQQAQELLSANEALQAEIADRRRVETELRHNEALLAAAQRIAHMGSWEWELASGRMHWSEENCRIHGIAPTTSEMKQSAAMEFVRVEDRKLTEAAFRKACDEKKPFSFVHRITRPDGEERIVHQRGDVGFDAEGRVVQVFGTAHDITERRRSEEELKQMHVNLLEVSRRAGMAEVATGVLHNVGNVLNSVNVSSMLITDRLQKSRISHLSNVATMLEAHAADLPGFFATDAKAQRLPSFIQQLSERLTAEREELLREVESLGKNIAHIKEIVAVQQSYAKVSGVIEALPAAGLVEDALEMNGAAFERHGIEIIREYAEVDPVRVDKHKVLQILINLIRNAKYAVSESLRPDKQVTVRVGTNGNQRVQIAIADNGVGIAKENLARIFAHGFTTKATGHGFGLHSAALAANEMGGSLVAHSDGLGKGATFTLELPIAEPSPTPLTA